jgi:hypothetical protein
LGLRPAAKGQNAASEYVTSFAASPARLAWGHKIDIGSEWEVLVGESGG